MSEEKDIHIKEEPQAEDDPSDAELDGLAEEMTAAEEIDAITALELEIKAAKEEAQTNLEGWQRAQAEFQNYKRRQERDSEMLREQTLGRVVKRYLEIVDDLDRALQNAPAEGEGAEWASGVELVYRKLLNILEAEGIKTMDVLGENFDPNLHEAIGEEDSDEYRSGQIIEIVQHGYWIGDRVLRPALVKVAA
jgi:molecular chaperone GrpE